MLCFVFFVQWVRTSSFPVATTLFILFCMETVCLMYPFSDPHITFCNHSYLVSLSWTVCTSSLKTKQDLHWYCLWPLGVKWVVYVWQQHTDDSVFAPDRKGKEWATWSVHCRNLIIKPLSIQYFLDNNSLIFDDVTSCQ